MLGRIFSWGTLELSIQSHLKSFLPLTWKICQLRYNEELCVSFDLKDKLIIPPAHPRCMQIEKSARLSRDFRFAILFGAPRILSIFAIISILEKIEINFVFFLLFHQDGLSKYFHSVIKTDISLIKKTGVWITIFKAFSSKKK